MSRVVLIGANGQLGTDLRREFPTSEHELITPGRADLDILNFDQTVQFLSHAKPAVIVNTAAFHKVEACESDPEQAFAVNCYAVRNLALAADKLGTRLVHISTDYVFDGTATAPYSETAPPNPINVYGASKLAGEFFVRNLCRRHLIVRTSGLYGVAGSSGKGGNFVQTMLRLGRERGLVSVVQDQVLSPTCTLDLARMVWRLVTTEAEGLYHVTSTGSCSWYEFAKAIFNLAGLTTVVKPILTSESGSRVRRPSYSVLENSRIRVEGFEPMPMWTESLRSYLIATGDATLGGRAPAEIGVVNAKS